MERVSSCLLSQKERCQTQVCELARDWTGTGSCKMLAPFEQKFQDCKRGTDMACHSVRLVQSICRQKESQLTLFLWTWCQLSTQSHGNAMVPAVVDASLEVPDALTLLQASENLRATCHSRLGCKLAPCEALTPASQRKFAAYLIVVLSKAESALERAEICDVPCHCA